MLHVNLGVLFWSYFFLCLLRNHKSTGREKAKIYQRKYFGSLYIKCAAIKFNNWPK